MTQNSILYHQLGAPVLAFTTTRQGGISEPPFDSLNLALHVADNPDHVHRNWALLSKTLQLEPDRLQFADQTHSANCAVVTQVCQTPIAKTDALITNQKGICLCILTADCIPVLLYDAQNKAIAAVHAGWRGTASNIAAIAAQNMTTEFGTKPQDLMVVIGPGISQAVYEVNTEVYEQFLKMPFNPTLIFKPSTKPGHYLLDLKLANTLQLMHLGVPKANIIVSPHCTFSEPNLFFSARKAGHNTGRMVSGITLI